MEHIFRNYNIETVKNLIGNLNIMQLIALNSRCVSNYSRCKGMQIKGVQKHSGIYKASYKGLSIQLVAEKCKNSIVRPHMLE